MRKNEMMNRLASIFIIAIFVISITLMVGCANAPQYDELSKINFETYKTHGDELCVPYANALRYNLYHKGYESEYVSVIMPDGERHAMTKVGKYYLDSHTNWPRERHELVNYTFLGDKHEL